MTGPPCYKLYSPSGSFFAFAPLIAAEFTGIPVTVETNGIEQSIALKSPTGKAPILETQQGEVIYSSRSISRFIAGLRRDTSLLGNGSLRQTSAIEDWMNWAQQEIELPATILYYFVSGFLPLNEEADTKAKEDMKSALEVLESHLQNVNSKDGVRTYLINSQHITLADIFLVSILIYPFTLVFDDVYLKHYKNTVRWFMNCVEQPEFIAVLGKIRLCKK